jgi:hypothetical protein
VKVFRQAISVLKVQSKPVVSEREPFGKISDRIVDLPVL